VAAVLVAEGLRDGEAAAGGGEARRAMSRRRPTAASCSGPLETKETPR
jgi:hypothetical protein